MSTDAESELAGVPGELVDLFMTSIGQVWQRDRDWGQLVILHCMVVVGATGDTRRSSTDWGAIRTAVEARLRSTVRSGVSERFLVMSLRDDVTRFATRYGDTGRVDENRRRVRQDLGDRLPPEVLTMFAPVGLDEATSGWGLGHFWKNLVAGHMSDQRLQDWEECYLARVYRLGNSSA